MARKAMDPAERARREREEAAKAIDAWVTRKTPPRKRRTASWDRNLVRAEVDKMIASDDWSTTTPKHLIELYAHLHERVYKTPALELTTAKIRLVAALVAGRAIREHFGGSVSEAVEFMRWVWREQASRQKRQLDVVDAFRVTWRYQWSAGLVTNYRRAQVHDRVG